MNPLIASAVEARGGFYRPLGGAMRMSLMKTDLDDSSHARCGPLMGFGDHGGSGGGGGLGVHWRGKVHG